MIPSGRKDEVMSAVFPKPLGAGERGAHGARGGVSGHMGRARPPMLILPILSTLAKRARTLAAHTLWESHRNRAHAPKEGHGSHRHRPRGHRRRQGKRPSGPKFTRDLPVLSGTARQNHAANASVTMIPSRRKDEVMSAVFPKPLGAGERGARGGVAGHTGRARPPMLILPILSTLAKRARTLAAHTL